MRREREIGVIAKDSRLCKVTFLGDVFDVAVVVVDRKVPNIYIKAAILPPVLIVKFSLQCAQLVLQR